MSFTEYYQEKMQLDLSVANYFTQSISAGLAGVGTHLLAAATTKPVIQALGNCFSNAMTST